MGSQKLNFFYFQYDVIKGQGIIVIVKKIVRLKIVYYIIDVKFKPYQEEEDKILIHFALILLMTFSFLSYSMLSIGLGI